MKIIIGRIVDVKSVIYLALV